MYLCGDSVTYMLHSTKYIVLNKWIWTLPAIPYLPSLASIVLLMGWFHHSHWTCTVDLITLFILALLSAHFWVSFLRVTPGFPSLYTSFFFSENTSMVISEYTKMESIHLSCCLFSFLTSQILDGLCSSRASQQLRALTCWMLWTKIWPFLAWIFDTSLVM